MSLLAEAAAWRAVHAAYREGGPNAAKRAILAESEKLDTAPSEDLPEVLELDGRVYVLADDEYQPEASA
jgi:hypothetical protein